MLRYENSPVGPRLRLFPSQFSTCSCTRLEPTGELAWSMETFVQGPESIEGVDLGSSRFSAILPRASGSDEFPSDFWRFFVCLCLVQNVSYDMRSPTQFHSSRSPIFSTNQRSIPTPEPLGRDGGFYSFRTRVCINFLFFSWGHFSFSPLFPG